MLRDTVRPGSAPQRRPNSRERRHARRQLERRSGESAVKAYERLSEERHLEYLTRVPNVDADFTKGAEFALRRLEPQRAEEQRREAAR